ncbi:MAG TPA: hypothetical protein VNC15_01530 [Solirubrobacterales bacterium]|jgi:hypothetical protein|nr:hypothetical protein [Solirubrobacterales bacterium]
MDPASVENALEERGQEIARMHPNLSQLRAAIASTEQRPLARRGGRGFATLATGLACLFLGVAAATAATGVLNPALDALFGGGDAPGEALSETRVPTWLRPAPGFNAPDEVSLLASAGSERLYAYRQSGNICFDYGEHVGECRSPGEWSRELERDRWILRGPVGKAEALWFGLVNTEFASVRIEYSVGAFEEVAVTNEGFVAVVDRARGPKRLVGLDASGEVVASRSLEAGTPSRESAR